MQVTRENKDALNAILNVNIVADDYKAEVEKILKDYRKNANIPGFRKGLVPMGLVKKQYGKAILIDEVNKILQDSVNKYIQEENLEILGNPLPIAQDDINWDGEEFNFQFELGFASEFKIDLAKLKGINSYKIVVDEETVNKQVEELATRFGNIVSQDEATDESNVSGKVEFLLEDGKTVDAEKEAKDVTVAVSNIKGKRNNSKFVGAKKGDVLVLKTKSLFNEDADLANFVGMTVEEVDGLEITVQFTINEVSKSEKQEINQDLFDKVYGPGAVDSEEAFKNKLKEEAERVYIGEVDKYFLNEVTEKLIDSTEVELPKEFLTKWLKSVSENPISDEEAAAEFEKSERGLKYQLIESRLFADNKMTVAFEDVKANAISMIKAQMAQFGQANMEEKELEDIAMRVLQNQEEYTRIAEQVKFEKLLGLYKEQVKSKKKEVTFDKFIELVSK
jgi:trigger factor